MKEFGMDHLSLLFILHCSEPVEYRTNLVERCRDTSVDD